MIECKITRREMLRVLGRLSLAALPAAGLSACDRSKESKRILDSKYQVAIVPCSSYDDEKLLNAINLGWRKTNHPNVKNKKVLDLGCGSGLYVKKLVKKGAKVKGIDLSPALINFAKIENM